MMPVIFKTRYRNTVAGSFRNRQKGSGKSKSAASGGSVGQVRIIAGRWRGRKLAVPDVEGLRPTGDRVRETLFNWLQDKVAGAQCLDLFAGSGALGFEALSRYAQSATFIEPDANAYHNLGHTCHLLDIPVADGWGTAQTRQDATSSIAHLYAGSAQSAIEHWRQLDDRPQYDLVFIDPPFQMACQWEILQDLQPTVLSDGAFVYVESPTAQLPPALLPDGCEIAREKRFGDVMARLVSYSRRS